jgi:hypothetical protein
VEPEVAALPGGGTVFEQESQGHQCLLEQLEPVIQVTELVPERAVLVLQPSRSQPQIESALREQVDGDRRLGQQGGVPEPSAEHQRAQPSPLGDGGQRREDGERLRRAVRFVPASAVPLQGEEEVIRHPQGVEAQPLGPPGDVRQLLPRHRRAVGR